MIGPYNRAVFKSIGLRRTDEDSGADNDENNDERGSDAGLSDALNLLLGKDLKKKLYDLHRDEDGIVDGEAVANDFVQILLDYKAGKNS